MSVFLIKEYRRIQDRYEGEGDWERGRLYFLLAEIEQAEANIQNWREQVARIEANLICKGTRGLG